MPLTIREQSDQLKAAAAERLPTEVLEVFDRSIQDLLDQGIPARQHQGGRRARTVHPRRRQPAIRSALTSSSRAARRSSCSTGAAGAPTAISPCAPTSRNSSPSWTPSVPDWSPSARSHRTSRSPPWKRPPWSSPSSPTRALVWPIGSASRSSKPTTSSPPSASSVST